MLAVRNVILFYLLAIARGQIVRIFGGSNALTNERPFQVSLQSSASSGHFCGGSILNENYVITAAHCTQTKTITLQPEKIQVAVGNTKISHPKSLHKVISIKRHEGFRVINGTAVDDIALLKVTPPFKFDDDVAPISLPSPHLAIRPLTKAVVSGWGAVTYPKMTMPEDLKLAVVSIIDQEYCKKAYEAAKKTIYPVHLCTVGASGQRKGSCKGDSGGPLTINDDVLVGIVSWSKKDPDCASPQFSNVHTRVSEYIYWIIKNAV